MKPGKLLGYFVLSNNPELYRGVSCYLKQVAPPTTAHTMFAIRKDLTPIDGETRCSIYLKSSLDYERVSSYILQIIGEVRLRIKKMGLRNLICNHSFKSRSETL